MYRSFFRITFLLILFSLTAFSQSPAKWSLAADGSGGPVKADAVVTATLTAEIEAGWQLYALEQPEGGPIATTIKISEASPFTISGKIRSPKPISKPDSLFTGMDGKPLVTKYYLDGASFVVPVKANTDTDLDQLAFDVRFQLCNDTVCLPPKTVRVSSTGFEDVKRGSAAQAVITDPADLNGDIPPAGTAYNNEPLSDDLWAFILLAMGAGLLSLLTPCVFPMIPITVSYFTNHAGGSRAKSIKLAVVYSLGIIFTFTILGMLLAVFVGAAGIQVFSSSAWVNLAITAIFLLFAFNLFGAYELTVPSGILTRLDNLTRSKEGDGSGIVGALLMGLTFTVTSFTCTSPFVGSIMVSSAQGDWQLPLIGMLAFSTVFALPFFVLALAPQLIAQLPRAGGWMNSIKVSMGFLEIAAAMKFLSNVDLVWNWGIFTRTVVLSVWIAIGLILTIYLLGKFQLFHDSKPERIGAVRLTSAIVSLAISFYLLTGLFGAKLGELESFLPPETPGSSSGFLGRGSAEPVWILNDYPAALAQARAENKRVFIDFTGYTCTNCRWMEANIFILPAVEKELSKFVRVKLYTDREGEPYEGHQRMEQEMFGTVALPFYAVVDADGKIFASFPGLTRNSAEFIDFLQKSQEN